MTPNLEQAARQALEAMIAGNDEWPRLDVTEAITALREALDHSGEADEMVVGWDRVKPDAIASDPLYQQGFVDGVEEGRNQVAEQAEQEPVGEMIDKAGHKGAAWYLEPPATGTKLYAAPVRTKDLTDDEIDAFIDRAWGKQMSMPEIIRAVIQEFRRKNDLI